MFRSNTKCAKAGSPSLICVAVLGATSKPISCPHQHRSAYSVPEWIGRLTLNLVLVGSRRIDDTPPIWGHIHGGEEGAVRRPRRGHMMTSAEWKK
eukprot:3462866-Amphidinium_carterae.1